MFNKIYVKVVKFIKEEYRYLLFLSLILFLGLFHLPYNLYVGGGIINLQKRVSIQNEYKEEGSFNLAYVKSIRATIPTYLLSNLFHWDKESINESKIDDQDTAKRIWEREKLYLQEANDNAILSAFKVAGENVNIKREKLKILYIDQNSETNLEIGDTILTVSGKEIIDYNDLLEIIREHEFNDRIEVSYLRDEKEEKGYFVVKNMNNEKKAGLYLIKLYDYEIPRDIKLKFSDSEGGPSGGFMLSLAIYNRIVEDDITKGRKIVGTGTIDKDGNVGEIGGVKYKLAGAVSNEADIFFVPEENYEEAIKEKKEKNYSIDVVMVKTLTDAISYLRG